MVAPLADSLEVATSPEAPPTNDKQVVKGLQEKPVKTKYYFPALTLTG